MMEECCISVTTEVLVEHVRREKRNTRGEKTGREEHYMKDRKDLVCLYTQIENSLIEHEWTLYKFIVTNFRAKSGQTLGSFSVDYRRVKLV